ncbi:MAG: class I SAM-dependent methyltransferase [Gemmatimonadota bacterium]
MSALPFSRVWRGLLVLSPGIVLRALRFGPGDAQKKLRSSYGLVAPLEGWESVEPDPLLPTVPIDELLGPTRGAGPPDGAEAGPGQGADPSPPPSRPQVTVAPTHVGDDGSLAPWELLCVLMLARNRNPRGILEIGTYFGTTAYNLALNLPHTHIHTVDLDPRVGAGAGTEASTHGEVQPGLALPADDFHLIRNRRLGEDFLNTPEARRITQHLGDSARVDLSAAAGKVTFCFIDGSHTYEYARNDTLRAVELLPSPGTLVWHDCSPAHPGVMKWLREMATAGVAVRRVRGTTLAVADIDPADAAVKSLLQRAS